MKKISTTASACEVLTIARKRISVPDISKINNNEIKEYNEKNPIKIL